MKPLSLFSAAGLILLANAAALIHVAGNRAGAPEAVMTLTQDQVSPVTSRESGVDLTIRWQMPGPGLSRAELAQFGFALPNAHEPYRRQPSRRGFVALENSPDKPELTVVDAAPQAATLRERHRDPNRILILPAVLIVRAFKGELTTVVSDLPVQIHVPRPFSTQLQAHPGAPYRLHLAWGRNHEPWVTGVDFPVTR